MDVPIALTLLDLVALASRFAESDGEIVALVTHLVNTERVVLCGNFAGQKFSRA